MPQSCSEQERLKQVIESTLVQICQMRVSFTEEVVIEGTVGISADKQNLFLLHFSSRLQQPTQSIDDTEQKDCLPGDAGVYMPSIPTSPDNIADDNTVTAATASSSQEPHSSAGGSGMRLGGAEALFSLHDYLNKPSFTDRNSRDNLNDSTSDPSKMSFTFPDTISIDIDSDTGSFSALPFDDYDDNEEDNDKSKVLSALELDKTGDNKNVIVIANKTALGGGGEAYAAPGTEEGLGMGGQVPTRRYGIAKKNIQAFDGTTVGNDNDEDDGEDDDDEEDEHVYTKRGKKTVHAVKKHTLLTCEICGREFTNNGLLEAHLVGFHGVTETKELGRITHFQCPFCPKKYRYQATLDKHVNRHRNTGADKKHRCNLCRNAYCMAESLSIHQTLHQSEAKAESGDVLVLECSVCDKNYSSKILFQKHIIYMHENPRKTAKKRVHEEDDDDDDEEDI